MKLIYWFAILIIDLLWVVLQEVTTIDGVV